MIIYGGIDEYGDLLSDMYSINLDTLEFISLKSKNVNPALAYSPGVGVYYSARDFSKMKPYFLPKINWTKAENYIQQEGIYFFGGKTREMGEKGVGNKLFCLTFGQKTLEIREVTTIGVPPKSRFHHSFNYMSSHNFIVLYGGRNDHEYSISGKAVLSDLMCLYMGNLLK